MSADANYFKIGIFILCGTALAVIAVVFLGAGKLFEKTVMIETYFEDSVQGLDVGSAIKFRGVPIGRVEEIGLVGQEYGIDSKYILVRATMDPETFRLLTGDKKTSIPPGDIKNGLRVRLGFQGLTGAAFLEADYVDTKVNPLLAVTWKPKYAYIPSSRSTISRISDSLERIMQNLEKADFKQMAAKLETSFATVAKSLEGMDMRQVGEQAKNLLTELRQTNQRLMQILKDPDIDKILTNTSAATASARKILESSEKPVVKLISGLTDASAGLSDLSVKLDLVLKDIPEDMKNVRSIILQLHELVATHQEDIDASIQNLRLFTEDLREMGATVKKYPSLILFGDPPRPSTPGEK